MQTYFVDKLSICRCPFLNNFNNFFLITSADNRKSVHRKCVVQWTDCSGVDNPKPLKKGVYYNRPPWFNGANYFIISHNEIEATFDSRSFLHRIKI